MALMLSGCATAPPLTDLEKKEKEWNRESVESELDRAAKACSARGGYFMVDRAWKKPRVKCATHSEFKRFLGGNW